MKRISMAVCALIATSAIGCGEDSGAAPTDGGAARDGAPAPDAPSDDGGTIGTDGGDSVDSSLPPDATYCQRWQALAAGSLPGFATDSACADYTDIPPGDAPCSGAKNDGATIAEVLIGQNHLLPPTADNYVTNEAKTFAMTGDALRPKFRFISHRPALLKVAVVGSGNAPEVKVIATRKGAPLGSLCLKGPATLPANPGATPSFDDSFTVQLPAAWIRAGIELEIQAGGADKKIPATDLRVGGGLRHEVVEIPTLIYGDKTPHYAPRYMPRMADELPVQSLIWSHFAVPMVLSPFVMSARSGKPDRVLTAREGSFDEVGEVLDIAATIRTANGQDGETSYFASLDPKGWGGGLGGGGGTAAGPASQLMVRHEGGHTYGLPHMEDAYAAHQYPFAKRRDGSGCVLGVTGQDGCGVGPYWKYFQYFGVVQSKDETQSFASPFDAKDANVYVRDPMAGGGDNWFGAYTDQWVMDDLQDHVYWDSAQNTYMKYDSVSGEFVADTSVRNSGYYDRPIQRDVPVYTLFGSLSPTVNEARVIQPPMHYRGHLVKTLDPTSDTDLAWLKSNSGKVCDRGCDFTVRVTFDGGKQRSYLLRHAADNSFFRWAINVADEGTVTKVELFNRPLRNNNGGNIGQATGATFFDTATLVQDRSAF
jgi:hypothetical protein